MSFSMSFKPLFFWSINSSNIVTPRGAVANCYQLLPSPSGSRRGEERQGRWCESVGQGLQERRRRRKRGIFGRLFVAKLKLHLDWGMDKISDYYLKASVFSEMYINDYAEKFWVEGYNLTKYFLIVMWQSECSFMFKIDGRNRRQNLDELKDSFSSIPQKLWDGDPNLLWPMCWKPHSKRSNNSGDWRQFHWLSRRLCGCRGFRLGAYQASHEWRDAPFCILESDCSFMFLSSVLFSNIHTVNSEGMLFDCNFVYLLPALRIIQIRWCMDAIIPGPTCLLMF